MVKSKYSFFVTPRSTRLATAAMAALMLATLSGRAQEAAAATMAVPATAATAQLAAQTSPEATPAPAAADNGKTKKAKVSKADRVQQSKDTKAQIRKANKYNPLVGKDAQLPDKQLFDKAMAQAKSGHFDVARLDLQALLSTYPDSQYQMRAKLAVADTWYREGGSAALAQAEQEYKDFITFFPNAPEAAEAQMRVGDIYFKQMDVPDRDYSKAVHAQEEYRNMLKQYPDAPKEVLLQARQKLREVQEVLATREADLALFYASHENWPASIARYKTVIDTYPQYSHMDDALIGLGDCYAAEARIVRTQAMPEGPKAQLEQEYDGKAAAAYREVVLKHAAAPHVEDAKERLESMGVAVPKPTPDQVAASEALEGSRAQYNLRRRLELIFLRKPDTVTAASLGDPPLEDAPATFAPTVVKSLMADYTSAFHPGAPTSVATTPQPAIDGPGETPPRPTSPPDTPAGPPPSLSDVPAAGMGTGEGSTSTLTEAAPAGASGPRVGGSGTSLGVDILTPGVTSSPRDASAPGPGSSPDTPPSSLPAATGQPDPNYGLSAVAPKNSSALPPIEQPAAIPDQVNDLAGKTQPAAETKDPAKKKNPKPAFDKDDESSSKHKKKKGLDKLNPF